MAACVIQQVTWSGGHVPSGEDSLFQFLGEPAKSGTYTFQAWAAPTPTRSIMIEWADPETGADPAPTIEAKSSIGGGGSSILTIVALVLGGVGVLVGGVALFSGSGRQIV